MSNHYILFIIIFIFGLNIISSTIILPFTYKNKKKSNNQKKDEINPKTSYFESLMDNTVYSPIKVHNQEIDFHITMERYPIYINDEIYKKFNDKNVDNKNDTIRLYSLDRIGINRASLINKTIILKSNISSENEIKEVNIFRARKFLNKTENERYKLGYASEEAEIGFNIVRGSQYQYVEEMENDLDTEEIIEDYEREKQRQKAYEEYYNLTNKDKDKDKEKDKDKNKDKSDLPSYNPLDEYEYDYPFNDEDGPKSPYDDEEIFDIYENENNNNNKPNEKNKKDENNNKKEDNKPKENSNEKYYGDGLFKEESANFISQLKKKDKINSYTFTIKYNSDGENGEIIIGDLPHVYAPDIYSPENYFFDSVSITKEPPFNWHFTYKKCLCGEEQIDTKNIVKFSIDFGFIRGNVKLEKYLEENFFNKNTCYKDKTKNNYYIYYCKEKAINNFKPLIFELESKYCPSNLNAKFEFDYKDLFIKENDIYYFQIVFPADGKYNNWVFGKPLFKKYQMVFDQDKKTYGFYVKLNDKKIENNNYLETSLKFSWSLVIILIIVSIVLLYFICKLIAKLPRRLKANELEDSFTYNPASKYSQISEQNFGNISGLNDKNKLYENL